MQGQAVDGLEPVVPFGETGVWGGGPVHVGAERFGNENPAAGANGAEGVIEEPVRNGGDGIGAVDDGVAPAPAFDESVGPGFEGGQVEVVGGGEGEFGAEGGEARAGGFEHVGFAVEASDGKGGGGEQFGEPAGACARFHDAEAVPVQEAGDAGREVSGMVFGGDEEVVFVAVSAIDFVHAGHGREDAFGAGKGQGRRRRQRGGREARTKMRWRMARQEA